MLFAVFNYNNCEVKVNNENNVGVVTTPEPDEAGNSPILAEGEEEEGEGEGEGEDEGLNNNIELDTDLNTGLPDGLNDGIEDDETGVVLSSGEKYQALLETYQGSGLHSELKLKCSSCHSGNHGSSDAQTSMDDLLTYKSNGKVNLNNPEESLLYTFVLSGHSGADADDLLEYITVWKESYESLATERLEEKIAAIEEEGGSGGGQETEDDDAPLNPNNWRSIDDLKFFSNNLLLPMSAMPLSFNIDTVGSVSIDIEYDESQGYYVLKRPTLSLENESDIKLVEMRAIINNKLQMRYGTWSSMSGTFQDGDIIGSGTMFIEVENPGRDMIQLGFVLIE